MDEVIFEEFKGTGNMELVLDRDIANKRIYPAIDINRSGTRREELLLATEETNRVYLLRSFLGDMPADEAITFLAKQMSRSRTNREFFIQMASGGAGG
jgi:transcription termination factor Rho